MTTGVLDFVEGVQDQHICVRKIVFDPDTLEELRSMIAVFRQSLETCNFPEESLYFTS